MIFCFSASLKRALKPTARLKKTPSNSLIGLWVSFVCCFWKGRTVPRTDFAPTLCLTLEVHLIFIFHNVIEFDDYLKTPSFFRSHIVSVNLTGSSFVTYFKKDATLCCSLEIVCLQMWMLEKFAWMCE